MSFRSTERQTPKTGALGSVVSAMGCAACFPALA
ncbi:TPA: mercury transport protein MerC, partial [Escherichia coli]|nr:mercury transport protein MerC [Escherichia coli]